MSLQLVGKSGLVPDVTLRNMLRTLAVIQSPQWDSAANEVAGAVSARSWTYTSTVTPTGAADHFFYLSNTSQRNLMVTRLQATAASADIIELNVVTGTPVGGTTLAPLNRTLGNARVPQATAESAVDITGITDGGTYERLDIGAGATVSLELINRPIVIPNGQAIALTAVTGTAAVQFWVDVMSNFTDPVDLT